MIKIHKLRASLLLAVVLSIISINNTQVANAIDDGDVIMESTTHANTSEPKKKGIGFDTGISASEELTPEKSRQIFLLWTTIVVVPAMIIIIGIIILIRKLYTKRSSNSLKMKRRKNDFS